MDTRSDLGHPCLFFFQPRIRFSIVAVFRSLRGRLKPLDATSDVHGQKGTYPRGILSPMPHFAAVLRIF